MFDKKRLDQLVHDLLDAVPENLKKASYGLEKNFREILQSTFSKLDLVTREEFDAQVKALERVREKLNQMEKELKTMEEKSKTRK